MAIRQRQLFADEDLAPWETDERADRLIAVVVFAEAVEGEYDYLVPESLRGRLQAGCRVVVPLGRANRAVTGYCVALRSQASVASRRLKELRDVVDEQPLLSSNMLQVTKWMADYYLCGWGQAMEAAVPAGVRSLAGTRETIWLEAEPEAAARASGARLSPQQRRALQILSAAAEPLSPQQLATAAGCSLQPIQQLRKKRLVRVTKARGAVRSPAVPLREQETPPPLNEDQQRALEQITASIQAGQADTFLIHGVTGSGKTEVYIRAMEQVLPLGRQALVLVPEISLTPQTQQRFRSRFPHVAVLHSHLSDAERHWHWRQIAAGQVQVVVGARSAVFAPTPRLGLIVIDEEHDASFKQDSVPRYHARDVARQRCRLENAPLVLGSATPSLESYQAALQGDDLLLRLPHRVHQQLLPHVAVIDLRIEVRSKYTRGAISRPLHQAIAQALRDEGQIILLLNRRGFSTSIQCPACGHAVKCPACDICLTHHREGESAICHYCDYQTAAPTTCPQCGFAGIRYRGLGTQRLEAEVRARFPDVPCLRMDSDTMQKPGAHELALTRFRRGEIRILLGTQMIAKGLDFPNVTLVGVINADTALHFPNFRAAERTFQLVTQVAGRTGRGRREGRVLVQTSSPDHPAILAATHHDYESFARQELPSRERFQYPPFGALVRLIVRGDDERTTASFAERMAGELARRLAPGSVRIVGPAPAPIAKLRGQFRFHLLLLAADHGPIRAAIREIDASCRPPEHVQWAADVDPLDML